MKSIELFAGAGGLGMGAELAGFSNVLAVEWDKWAVETLQYNRKLQFPLVNDWDIQKSDVRAIDFANYADKVELVTGGPPCQPFSMAGKHKAFDDKRDMFGAFADVLAAVAPKAFVAENVKGLTRAAFSNYLEYVKLRLRFPLLKLTVGEIWYDHLHRLERHAGSNSGFDLQYEIYSELMNSADYGVPQKRERYFIVGFRKDIRAQFSFPSATHSKEALLNAKFFDRSYFEDHDIAMVKNNLSANAIRRLEDWRGSNAPKTIRWRTVRDALVGLPAPKAAQSGYWASRGHKYQSGAKSYKGHTGSPLDEPAKTLKAGVHGVPGGENMLVRTDGSVRYFTMREAARLQTFSDTYVFQGAWSVVMRQLGNAVPVALAQAVLKSVATSLIEADMQVLSQTSPNARAI